jgi:hypothetical protein
MFPLSDGVSFVHLVETEDEHDPLPDVPAFRRFQGTSANAARTARS